jgi:hypothetical protein
MKPRADQDERSPPELRPHERRPGDDADDDNDDDNDDGGGLLERNKQHYPGVTLGCGLAPKPARLPWSTLCSRLAPWTGHRRPG